MGRYRWHAGLGIGLAAAALFGLWAQFSSPAGEVAPLQVAPKRSSSALAITADGATLLVVNPDSNTLTLVDLLTRSAAVELPVGLDPRTVTVDDAGRRAYVANRGSHTVTAVDLGLRQVVAEVPVGYRPYGVLVSPDGSHLYVAEQGADRVTVLDTESLLPVWRVPTADRPSGLALSADGETLYVTHLLANQISVIRLRRYWVYLPLLLKGGPSGGTAVATWSSWRMTPVVRQAAGLSLSQSLSLPLWPDSNLVQSIVLSPDGEQAFVPHTRSNSSNPDLKFDTTVLPMVSQLNLNTGQHRPLDLATIDPPGVGLPYDAALGPDGHELWVVNAASNDVTVVDLATRQRVAHIEVGDNPRAILLAPDGSAAYVNNTLAGTVSILDTASYTVSGVITVTQIPLPPALLSGKRLFHSSDDPRISRFQWISCNSCHYEGEHDGRTWTFSFAGPRNTTGLLGLIETYPLRWSGEWDESADSEYANRFENFGAGLIQGPLNCTPSPADCLPPHLPNQGRSVDLDSLAAFIDSLTVPLSPSHAHGEPLGPAESRGQVLFHQVGCAACHPPPLYTDQLSHDVGTATPDEVIGPAYDTPSLRGLYDSAPYFHDGSAPALLETLIRPSPGSEHDLRLLLSESQMQDLIAFLLALPFE